MVDTMQKYQVSLASLLLLAGGLPIWLFLIVVVPQSTGWGGNPIRFVTAPLVLGGMTVAIRRLFGKHQEAWAISVLLAAIIALASSYAALWMSNNR
jgi:hypothetical protein